MINKDADEVEIKKAVKDWILRTTKQGMSDVYVFFAGHGLASSDGSKMFLLPYDGSLSYWKTPLSIVTNSSQI